ncbi:hypothetical protein I317_03770 [Kwoniella heveanensis CBS 569]|uniref:Oxidoreductase n=1 Tax=Kwoniella heveanensis BCC8398 TaxID=1296120 RepID=A0A1B9GUY0_9TREE|nr:hypothetical protein I316_03738 [Kwoniella heveanensis BCC8398]OCF42395.1 hypothetical protein I317_03770 [Kwoniella heveanensis CBS 569]
MLSGVALITGAGGCGIGAAISRAFAKSGCTKLVLTDMNRDTLQQTVQTIQHAWASSSNSQNEILAIPGDISSPSFVDSLFSDLKSKFGRLDYAVNCAGISGNNAPTFNSTMEDFDKINGVNYRGLWYCSKKELEMMKQQDWPSRTDIVDEIRRQRGSIVNVASQLGVVGRPDAPIYCASKSAVIGLTRCDAIDASPYNIRVNAICPGIVHTPMTDNELRPSSAPADSTSAGAGAENAEAEAGSGKDMQGPMDLTTAVNIAPMRRMGTPDEIADIVVFLSSEKASFVQGAAWVADGGYTIN